MSAVKDETGKRFGRLVAIKQLKGVGGSGRRYLCKCDCGNEKIVVGGRLRSGGTKSCGCYWREKGYTMARTHGLSIDNKGKQTKLHRVWSNMKARCSVPSHFAFKNYGARGISVCDDWFHNYLSFHEWAMSSGYAAGLSIDRIDNNKGYHPDNCRWATAKQQNRNTRKSVLTTVKANRIKEFSKVGISRKDISNIFGISTNHVTNIINNHRWAA